jgi:hypothetical protein
MWASSIVSKQIGLSCKTNTKCYEGVDIFNTSMVQHVLVACHFPLNTKAEPVSMQVCKTKRAYQTKSLSLSLNEFTMPSWIGGWGRFRRRLPALSPADVDMCVLQYFNQARSKRRINDTSQPSYHNSCPAKTAARPMLLKTPGKITSQQKNIVSADISSRLQIFFFKQWVRKTPPGIHCGLSSTGSSCEWMNLWLIGRKCRIMKKAQPQIAQI